ncbi:MAG: hypothetical protein ACFFB3_24160 [Candidatus Hodarchaeota archaeon]
MKNLTCIGLAFLLVLSLIAGYFILLPANLEGSELGHFIFSLFIFAEIPLLVNYFYFVISRSGLMPAKISRIFPSYYGPGLILHSVVYTVLIGLIFTHALLLEQEAMWCAILLLIPGLIWIIEYILWIKNWPLYPGRNQKALYLYWFYWVLLFGFLIGLPFHAKTWSLFWAAVIPILTFGTLLWIILQDVRSIRIKTQRMGQVT